MPPGKTEDKPVPPGETEPTPEEILGAPHLAESRATDAWSVWDELRAIRGGFWLIRRTAETIHAARQLSDRETLAWYVNHCTGDYLGPVLRAALGIQKGGVL